MRERSEPSSSSVDERSESTGVRLMRERSADRAWLTVVAVVALAVAGAAVVPALTDARPANEVPVGEVDAAADPTAESWSAVPSADLALASAPSGVPQASNVSAERARVRAATNGSHVFVRVSWDDPTVDRNAASPRRFADAVAVQFPANASAHPPIAMGGPENRVNVWYWRAGGSTEELLAGGAGSTTPFADRAVDAAAARENGTWHVTFVREAGLDGNRTAFAGDRDVDVAVAVWNGSNGERAGRKAVSEWHYLATGPGPQGPPYETILWTVAGLAILFVTLVTVEGVRRTRGERA